MAADYTVKAAANQEIYLSAPGWLHGISGCL
jgi:hypothetical protein